MPLTQSIQERFVQWRESCRCLSPKEYLSETGLTMEELCGVHDDACPFDEVFGYDEGAYILGDSSTHMYTLILNREEYQSPKISELEPIHGTAVAGALGFALRGVGETSVDNVTVRQINGNPGTIVSAPTHSTDTP